MHFKSENIFIFIKKTFSLWDHKIFNRFYSQRIKINSMVSKNPKRSKKKMSLCLWCGSCCLQSSASQSNYKVVYLFNKKRTKRFYFQVPQSQILHIHISQDVTTYYTSTATSTTTLCCGWFVYIVV